jgi:hypothetical protein
MAYMVTVASLLQCTSQSQDVQLGDLVGGYLIISFIYVLVPCKVMFCSCI